MEKAPIWAYRRALEIISQDSSVSAQYLARRPPEYFMSQRESADWPSVHALARYISEKEEPPVDPDLLLAREIVALSLVTRQTKEDTLRGEFDNSTSIQNALAGIKKGRELGRSGK